MAEKKRLTAAEVWSQYEKGMEYKRRINLFDTVENNENFFIGKQWEGVEANGLPTPVFNFIKRIVLFQVASTATDNIAMAVSPMSDAYPGRDGIEMGRICQVVKAQLDALIEDTRLPAVVRDFMRDAAVRGDGCIYSWFDPEAETGQTAKGAIKCELLENTRVILGNPNTRDIQSQPYVIIARRERMEDVRREAEEAGLDLSEIKAEEDELGDRFDKLVDNKVTTLTRFEKRDGTVRCVKTVKGAVLRSEWETGMKLYPLVWMCWEHVTGSCHGQAVVTGLIPNQIFINKAYAMTMISLMTTAYPKIIFNKQLIGKWDSRVGAAIGVNGGDINNVARTMDPSPISPQVAQFIEMAMSMTKELSGATDAALGNVRPDNMGAILALQKSSQVPLELVKQDQYQAIEDYARIWLDQMRAYYGVRAVKADGETVLFDFAALGEIPLGLKLDVGGSAYWNEIAQLQTLNNLLSGGYIEIIDYLERLPNGYIADQQELIRKLKERQKAAALSLGEGTLQEAIPADQPAAI